MQKSYFTSESVTAGHPDKLCDAISDQILDAIIEAQPEETRSLARSAVEVMALPGMVVVGGEVSCDGYVDIPAVARLAIIECGYADQTFGFDGRTCAVLTSINEQSPDIQKAVNKNGTFGAGDQGLMFGYACNETPELMPIPIVLAHKLARRLHYCRLNTEAANWMGPDGKTQVTIEYEGDKPIGIDTVVISCQHAKYIEQKEIEAFVTAKVIEPVTSAYVLEPPKKILVNPSGSFIKGGPCADSGLTGRKIIVDTYGGYARHGGGAFSGKDPTKMDRTGAYMARHLAKSIVQSFLATRCEVQLSYAIGKAEPVAVRVDTFGTGIKDDRQIEAYISAAFDLTPHGIIKQLHLFDPARVRFSRFSAYGHFGRDAQIAPWEETEKLEVW